MLCCEAPLWYLGCPYSKLVYESFPQGKSNQSIDLQEFRSEFHNLKQLKFHMSNILGYF